MCNEHLQGSRILASVGPKCGTDKRTRSVSCAPLVSVTPGKLHLEGVIEGPVSAPPCLGERGECVSPSREGGSCPGLC